MQLVTGNPSTPFFVIFMSLVLGCPKGSAAALEAHDAISTSLEALIETRSLIGKEQAEWLKEKALIKAQAEAWKVEGHHLTEQITSLKAKLKRFLPAEESDLGNTNDLRKTSDTVSQVLETIEEKLTSIFPRLPIPLRSDLEVYIGRLSQPTGSAIRSLDTRCRNLVYLLDRIHEFDQQFTLHWDTRQHPDGSEVLVQVLYLGLSRAYFVDARGEIAGTGSPSDTDWKWSFDSQWAKPVQDAIAVHERRASPSIVRLPASIE